MDEAADKQPIWSERLALRSKLWRARPRQPTIAGIEVTFRDSFRATVICTPVGTVPISRLQLNNFQGNVRHEQARQSEAYGEELSA
jgi:hypothetical protein